MMLERQVFDLVLQLNGNVIFDATYTFFIFKLEK